MPCPGYPHAEQPAQPDEFGLTDCPHCTEAVVDFDEHLKTCIEAPDNKLAEARRLLAESERQQTEACLAELEAVLAKYGRRLQITEPKISIVPL